MTSNVFLDTGLTPQFMSNYFGLQPRSASCIAHCQEIHTDENGNKIGERGWCKAGCWVETVVKAVTATAAVLVAVKQLD